MGVVAVHSCMYVMECCVASGFRELLCDFTERRLVPATGWTVRGSVVANIFRTCPDRL